MKGNIARFVLRNEVFAEKNKDRIPLSRFINPTIVYEGPCLNEQFIGYFGVNGALSLF